MVYMYNINELAIIIIKTKTRVSRTQCIKDVRVFGPATAPVARVYSIVRSNEACSRTRPGYPWPESHDLIAG